LSSLTTEILLQSGLHNVAKPFYTGRGCILTFHRVVSGKDDTNRISWSSNLEVTVNYLQQVLDSFQKEGYYFISLDELPDYLKSKSKQKFAIATFDDGYKDNLELGLPLFKAMNIPMCIYVCTGLGAKECDTWWYDIEEILLNNTSLDLTSLHFDCTSKTEKANTYLRLRELIIHRPFAEGYRFFEELKTRYPVKEKKVIFEALQQEEIKQLSHEKLVTIGAHTHSHFPLSKLAVLEMKDEMQRSKKMLEEITGKRILHFAYPYGSAEECSIREFNAATELGFRTATTTRQGHIFNKHSQHLTALPRIPVIENDNEKKLFYLSRSGFLPAYMNKLKRVVTD